MRLLKRTLTLASLGVAVGVMLIPATAAAQGYQRVQNHRPQRFHRSHNLGTPMVIRDGGSTIYGNFQHIYRLGGTTIYQAPSSNWGYGYPSTYTWPYGYPSSYTWPYGYSPTHYFPR